MKTAKEFKEEYQKDLITFKPKHLAEFYESVYRELTLDSRNLMNGGIYTFKFDKYTIPERLQRAYTFIRDPNLNQAEVSFSRQILESLVGKTVEHFRMLGYLVENPLFYPSAPAATIEIGLPK